MSKNVLGYSSTTARSCLLGLIFSALAGLTLVASAQECITVAAPNGLTAEWPQQLELAELEAQTGSSLTFSDNPLFAQAVAAGQLPPVDERLPAEPLVVIPYESCGVYGGSLRGTSRAPESGTSEFLSWRQVNLVRMSDDLRTIVPNVAKSWTWNDDLSAITFVLREGHKWSDGSPFTADDVVFYIDDLVKNQELHGTVPAPWLVAGEPVVVEKVDDLTFTFRFAAPNPGLLHYFATGGSYFAPYAPAEHYKPYHISYNQNADQEARDAGFDGWTQRFGQIWDKWKDAEVLTAHALTRPTLESHVLEIEADTQRRVFVANPYYFKVDTRGQQLPYVDRHIERFLDPELNILAILNGEVHQKAQGVRLADYPLLKENEAAGGYAMRLPPGSVGSHIAFNITHRDPVLRQIYGDVRFRQAMSLAIDRDELNETLYFGLGTPKQALPPKSPFTTDADRNYMIDFDVDRANALLDEMGMARGSDGRRVRPDGRPMQILWEYSSQFASPELVQLVSDYWRDVGISVQSREITSALTREKAWNNENDINMEWDAPYEPNLISQINYYIPPYTDIGPLFGVPWLNWINSGGSEGEKPPPWAARMFELAEEWRSIQPGTERYLEIGRELVQINLENMTIIGLVSNLPGPTVVADSLRNVTEWQVQHFNYGRTYPVRPDQWYFGN
ncbi:MAG: ABC transporter substrate-binding protein [Trueperaceae bacterium]